jgi:hypothetical protein
MKFFSETSSHRPPSTFLTSYFGISICILQLCPAVFHKSLRLYLNAIQNQAQIHCDGFNIGEYVQIIKPTSQMMRKSYSPGAPMRILKYNSWRSPMAKFDVIQISQKIRGSLGRKDE